ncbi:uncharacterized protein BJ171DRAFT_255023 [Polychytrium aggregatum]|uniref:uncharacterized protein n=1 Tax=Polychytrium aggregatum TaxID=110093 RepID=UPI0022FDDADC|nr:uncharacterized protein BJ171DRAFT_255023 [Polychytrium aggregatum]KAI9207775.1 hypothetical protein BJ171DRAFT_255023 [Polychytrium aggregatum]
MLAGDTGTVGFFDGMVCRGVGSPGRLLNPRIKKEKLHHKSLETVKTWENTIMGQRKKRLAAQAEREKSTEEERKKVDAAWELVRQDERRIAVERARRMQYVEQSRVKALHAQLLMSNVLHEREQQIIYKAQEDEAVKTVRQMEDDKERLQRELKNKKLDEAREQAYLATLQVAEFQRHQAINRENEERRLKQEERDFYSKVNEKALHDERMMEEKDVEKHRKQTEEIRRGLSANMRDKEETERRKREEEQRVDDGNHRFHTVKLSLNNKRKDAERTKFQIRQQRLEEVARQQEEMSKEKDQRIDGFIAKNADADWGGQIQKEIERKKKTAKMIKEIEEFRLAQVRRAWVG